MKDKVKNRKKSEITNRYYARESEGLKTAVDRQTDSDRERCEKNPREACVTQPRAALYLGGPDRPAASSCC